MSAFHGGMEMPHFKGHQIEKSPYKTIDGRELWRLDLRDLKTAQVWKADSCPHFRSVKAAQDFVDFLYALRKMLYAPALKEAINNGDNDSTASLNGSVGPDRQDAGSLEVEGPTVHASSRSTDEPEHD